MKRDYRGYVCLCQYCESESDRDRVPRAGSSQCTLETAQMIVTIFADAYDEEEYESKGLECR
jgi:hypothetical protein